ncbi:MAG: hypothetical protein KAJ42_11465 [Gemmatimonadetes bacterium]|nr:hypothetical protein [Gemmatimonadota bacterium]
MGKIIILVICAFGAALYFPNSRARLLHYLDPVVAPVLEWSTMNEMESIAGDLSSDSRTGRQIPERPQEFMQWMERNYEVGGDTDGWGNYYSFRSWPDSFGIISNGRDLEIDTADDLIVTRPHRRRRR